VDEAYAQFTSIVAEGRGMDQEKVRRVADGRIYTAKQAKDNGLIDDVLSEKEAVEAVKEEMGDDKLSVSDVRFMPADDIFGLSGADPFSIFGFSSGNKKDNVSGAETSAMEGDIERVLDLATMSDRVPLKYLYSK
jgi:ClpP class serine protease